MLIDFEYELTENVLKAYSGLYEQLDKQIIDIEKILKYQLANGATTQGKIKNTINVSNQFSDEDKMKKLLRECAEKPIITYKSVAGFDKVKGTL